MIVGPITTCSDTFYTFPEFATFPVTPACSSTVQKLLRGEKSYLDPGTSFLLLLDSSPASRSTNTRPNGTPIVFSLFRAFSRLLDFVFFALRPLLPRSNDREFL